MSHAIPRALAPAAAWLLALGAVARAQSVRPTPNLAAPLSSSSAPASATAPPASSSAGAPGPAALSETLTGDTKADYLTGRQLLAEHDFEGALARFIRVYAQVPDPRVLANIALCETRLSRCARAITLFGEALSTGGSLFSPSQTADIRSMVQDCNSHVGRLRVIGAPAGATIEVDDARPEPAAQGSSDFVVDAGTHRVRVTLAGYRDFVASIAISAGARASLTARLQRAEALGTVVEALGAMAVRATPEATIAVDGRAVGKGRWEGRVAPGMHAISITADGMQTYRADVRVSENQTRTLDVTLAAAHDASPWMWAAAGGVVLAGIVVAIVSVFHPADPVGPSSATVSTPQGGLRRR